MSALTEITLVNVERRGSDAVGRGIERQRSSLLRRLDAGRGERAVDCGARGFAAGLQCLRV
eukprot:SAG11_NODE_1816_length_4215_cov_2.783042_3_plen_61_part_00